MIRETDVVAGGLLAPQTGIEYNREIDDHDQTSNEQKQQPRSASGARCDESTQKVKP